STDNFATYVNASSALTPGARSFSWTVPSALNSSSVKVRVRALDVNTVVLAQDNSDNNFTVSQPATPSLTVNPLTRSVAAGAGNTSFDVSNTGSGTMSYSASVTSGSSWLTITSGGSGGNSGTINVSFTANTGAQHSGTIQITATGATGSPSTVTVIQTGSGGVSLIYGVDVSHWQGVINWSQVKLAGRDYAFIKATESVDFSDDKFSANMVGAKNAGLLVAPYHFARPSYGDSPEAEAGYFVSIAGAFIISGNLRPVLDFEDDDSLTTMSNAQLTDWVSRWATEVKRLTGADPILYMDGRFVSRLTSPATSYPLWFASPDGTTTQPSNVGNFSQAVFKQYDWHGSVAGIPSEVDLDVFYGDMSALQSYVISASPTGSLLVSLAPAGAVSAGAQWQVDGGALQNSGATVSSLSVGSHTVAFKTVSGWTTPGSQTVTVNASQTTTASGTDVARPQTGSLQVSLAPAGAVSAGAQWQVDGGAWQNSGAIVSSLSVGSHTVAFNTVSGWTTPGSQNVTITANVTTPATGTYVVIPQTGSLQVSLAPAGAVSAGAQWQVDGGALQNSGATVSGLSVGSHTVTFNTVSGWTTPGSQTITVNASQTTTATGTYVAISQTGSLQVSLAPAGAVSAGAQWQVDGGALQNSGATVSGLSVGTHTVAFNTVSGWTTPGNQTVTVTANQTTTAIGTYNPQPCSATLLNPATGVVVSGAPTFTWSFTGSCSNKIYITTNPAPELIVVLSNVFSSGMNTLTVSESRWNTVLSRFGELQPQYYWTVGDADLQQADPLLYAPWQPFSVLWEQTGSLQVSLAPAGAVSAGAQWQVDGGALQNSGATVSGLSVGTHTVTFNTVSGWTTPDSQTVTVSASQTTTATGTYVAIPQTGSLQVSLAPAGAVSAGAQWQVDGGALQNSGATVSGLSVGSHTVTFNTVSGWTTPGSQTVTVSASQTTTATGTYVATPTVAITLASSPSGLLVSVDGGTATTTPVTLNWTAGSTHTISTPTTQYSGDNHTRYTFSLWSDIGASSHTITTPGSATTYTASFSTQYLLDTAVSPPSSGYLSITFGSGSPPWFNPGQTVSFTASANSGYTFSSWSGVDSLSANTASVTMNSYRNVTAYFTATPTKIISLSGNLEFGNIAFGSPAQSTLTITNTGNSTLTVSSISYPSGFSGNWSSGTIVASGSQNVTVTFSPSAVTNYGGTVTVNSDKTSGVNTIAASGTGTSILNVDLLITNFTASVSGSTVIYQLTAVNQGSASITQSFFIDLFYDLPTAPGQTNEGEQYTSIASLGAGQTQIVTLTRTNAPVGTYQAWCYIDSFTSSVPESNEGNNVAGPITVTVGAGPANDNFANRISIAAPNLTVSGSNVNASKESNEPNHANISGGKSVWWTWTAPTSGTVTIDTIGSSFDTVLGIYTGTTVSGLTLVASDDDGGGNTTSRVTFNAVGGTAYQIAVDGFGGVSGSIILSISQTSAPSGPIYFNSYDANFVIFVENTSTPAPSNGSIYVVLLAGLNSNSLSPVTTGLGTITNAITGDAPYFDYGVGYTSLGNNTPAYFRFRSWQGSVGNPGAYETATNRASIDWTQNTGTQSPLLPAYLTFGGQSGLVLQPTSPPPTTNAVTVVQSAAGYRAGTTNTIACQLTYPAGRQLLSLGWRPALPAGWTLTGAAGDGSPEAQSGEIVFTAALTANPINFTFNVAVPAGHTGTKAISSQVDYQMNGMINPATTNHTLNLDAITYHAADYRDARWLIDGTEVNRVLSYWRAGAYSVNALGADGFAAGSGATNGARHTADYRDPAWLIDGTEVNRVLAYWRAGAYHADAAGADGYAPGAASGFAASSKSAKSFRLASVGGITHSSTNYTPGSTVTVSCTFTYTGTLLSLIWRPQLPAGWTLVSATGNGSPESQFGEIVWTGSLPPSPITMSYTVQVPATNSGAKQLRGEVESQFTGDINPTASFAAPDPLTLNSSVSSPQITVPPASQTVSFGGGVTFSVSATGSGLTYQWRLNGTAIPGATGSSYIIPVSTLTNIGFYDVAVMNTGGTNYSTAASLAFVDLKMFAGVVINGPIGANYRVEYTTNLASTNWTTLTNIALPAQPYIYIDYDSPGSARRFYQAVPLP
ncbi:MAG: choice-of-anchor D domain-containing protein, partial [Verrucomicrobia bacterium]|nr:choice-of-anchor D domain-containing protein [Verrucomicrobiota bacterium]